MLVEQRLRAFAALLVLCALRLAATKPRTIGVGLLRRGFLCGALPESIEIDDVTHGRIHHAKTAEKERTRREEINLITIQNPRMPIPDSTNNGISLCENQFFAQQSRVEGPHPLAVMTHNNIN
jgi:hypothetical protein